MKITKFLWVFPVAGLLALAACKTTPEMTNRPDFLSNYDHLHKIEPGVWRYVSQPLLANCSKFTISTVKVMFTDYEGTPITEEQRQHSADFIRQTLTKAISQWYPVVSESGPGVGEIRVALTSAYATAGKLGLCVQGEILDNSKAQVAAVVRTELSESYSANWEDRDTAREMVENWAQRLVKAIDDSRRK